MKKMHHNISCHYHLFSTMSITGMQLGYTKYCCFIGEWDSRVRDTHYIIKRDWPCHKRLVLGQKNVHHEPLVDPKEVFLPLLHIKLLGLATNFVKASNIV